MTTQKSIAISFRVTPRFKQLLEAAAARERRSLTNMMETLLLDYCEQHGVDATPQEARDRKPFRK